MNKNKLTLSLVSLALLGLSATTQASHDGGRNPASQAYVNQQINAATWATRPITDVEWALIFGATQKSTITPANTSTLDAYPVVLADLDPEAQEAAARVVAVTDAQNQLGLADTDFFTAIDQTINCDSETTTPADCSGTFGPRVTALDLDEGDEIVALMTSDRGMTLYSPNAITAIQGVASSSYRSLPYFVHTGPTDSSGIWYNSGLTDEISLFPSVPKGPVRRITVFFLKGPDGQSKPFPPTTRFDTN